MMYTVYDLMLDEAKAKRFSEEYGENWILFAMMLSPLVLGQRIYKEIKRFFSK